MLLQHPSLCSLTSGLVCAVLQISLESPPTGVTREYAPLSGERGAADQAHLRSHSGLGAWDAMLGCPTGFEFQLQPELFGTLVFERLRLPLNITDETCACGAALDTWGDTELLARAQVC